jgi:hypothetical protein
MRLGGDLDCCRDKKVQVSVTLDVEITQDGHRLQVQVLSQYGTVDEYVEWSRAWIQTCVDSPLIADLLAAVNDAPAPNRATRARDYLGPVGEPGMAEGTVYISFDDSSERFRPFNKRNMSYLQTQLAKVPQNVNLRMSRLDENGNLANGNLMIKVERPLKNEWATFELLISRIGFSWLPDMDIALEMRRLAVQQAALTNASFAAVADDFANTKTALEYSAKLAMIEKTIPRSRERLRGYSWLTICPPGIAVRLGGAEGLRASGAFFDVEEISTGAVVLQATERFDDYREPQVIAVFEALAPVLIPGITMRPPTFVQHQRIVFDVDAVTYRRQVSP